MKKNIFRILFCALTMVGGLILQSCPTDGSGAGAGAGSGSGAENSFGILKLTNNSSVQIVYVSLEKGGKKTESRVSISSGSSKSFGDTPTGSYTVYLEDADGDGWATKSSVTVKKDSTVEIKFPNDFKVSN